MSGKQKEEPDKASMCEWGIWWESRRPVSSRNTKKCSMKRGGGMSASVREA